MQLVLRFYQRALRTPIRVGEVTLAERRGFWIEVSDGGVSLALAECAPLPGLHRETLTEAADLWRRWAAAHREDRVRSLEAGDEQWTPATQSSLDMLRMSWNIGQHPERWPLSQHETDRFVPLCGLLHLTPAADQNWWQDLRDLKQAGYQTIKVKVGRLDRAVELERLSELRAFMGPQLRLRLDANGRLDAETAAFWTEALRGWPIDYWEDPSEDDRIKRLLPWPLARDEIAWGAGTKALSPEDLERVSVLKPNVIGFRRFVEAMLKASESPKRLVLSNAYESSLSLHLYAWIYGRCVTVPEALGFGTQRAFLHDDFPFAAELKTGRLRWPDQPFFSIKDWPEVTGEEVLWS